MKIGLLGRKLGMTRVYDEKGRVTPVTVIEAGGNSAAASCRKIRWTCSPSSVVAMSKSIAQPP